MVYARPGRLQKRFNKKQKSRQEKSRALLREVQTVNKKVDRIQERVKKSLDLPESRGTLTS